MSKVIYDLIQRFEVEDGVPRLIASTLNVISGGEDLFSTAQKLLEERNFSDFFVERKASQYVGYRKKVAGGVSKRSQLIISQRKDGICISLPEEFLKQYIIQFRYGAYCPEAKIDIDEYVAKIWIIPSKKEDFTASLNPCYWLKFEELDGLQRNENLGARTTDMHEARTIDMHKWEDDGYEFHFIPGSEIIPREEFDPWKISSPDTYLILGVDKLFPYALQTTITDINLLKEFLEFFIDKLLTTSFD
ncbi:hypothetical protein H6F46_03135 [Limnothrix sp. FACHB-1083]|uniref:hypothetical protein n=1 Tax=unclassified Limnothrix TaxID=2632864 RepID=UPI0016803304|nr:MULTISPECIES: hypothetical protein [unclassified Limnothrix]MBD2159683.1 hypothetical protein [Limnothrix sp. FACHB-1083]MBD2190385.1 hypothetical protein [Limnothrix sp. FACHB-1088]